MAKHVGAHVAVRPVVADLATLAGAGHVVEGWPVGDLLAGGGWWHGLYWGLGWALTASGLVGGQVA